MTDNPNTRNRGRFFGRVSEVKMLQDVFEQVATKGADGKYSGPRMVTIVAESGLGKTRLAQELYVRLASDERWNPRDSRYWPTCFGDENSNLNVVPDLSNQRPKGPPRFLWMGARWRSPTEKNAAITTSALPELRSSLAAHAVVIENHLPAWKAAFSRASDALRRFDRAESLGTSGEAIEVIGAYFPAFADLLIAGFGTAVKTGFGGANFVADRLNGPRDYESVKKESTQSEGDEFLGRLRHLLSHAGALPLVILLDDAQWIDSASLDFLRKLWQGAESNRWPILFMATHWEREWEEFASAASSAIVTPQSFYELSKKYATVGTGLGAEVLNLKPSNDRDLERHLAEQLPGLTEEQCKLLVEKAGGNFLTLTENIGELIQNEHNFEGRNSFGPLSEEGEAEARTWESERERRVKQRFLRLETKARDLLGWGSYFGQRFIRDAVVEFASRLQGVDDAAALMSRCEKPYVILGKAGDLQSEFRDRAYHLVATEYFNRYGSKYRDALHEALREHLREWINNSFDEHGNSIWLSHELGAIPPVVRCATYLSPNERREIVALASNQFPLHPGSDWVDPNRSIGLRAICLAVRVAASEGSWSSASRSLDALEIGDADPIPSHILSFSEQIYLGHIANKLGRYEIAHCLVRSANAGLRYQGKEVRDTEQIRLLIESLDLLAIIERSRGQLESAISILNELLEVFRVLPRSHGNEWQTSIVLTEAAKCYARREEYGLAIDALNESLGIRFELSEEQGLSESFKADIEEGIVNGHIERGRVAEQWGDIDAAIADYEIALDIVRNSAKIKDKARLEAAVLMDIARNGGSELTDEDPLSLNKKALTLLSGDEGAAKDPDRQGDIGRVHYAIAQNHLRRGELAEARKSLLMCKEVRSKLCSEFGGSRNQEEFALALRTDAEVVAKMAQEQLAGGNINRAHELFTESLTLRRGAFAVSGAQNERISVASGLLYVGQVELMLQDVDSALAHFAEALREIGPPEEWDQRTEFLAQVVMRNLSEVEERRPPPPQ